MLRSVLLSIAALAGIAVQFALGLRWQLIAEFNQSVLGRALTGLLVSGVLIPYGKLALAYFPRSARSARLLDELASQLTKQSVLEDSFFRKRFLALFGRRKVELAELQRIGAAEAAVFMLGLQLYHREVQLDPGLDLFALTEVATKAARDARYRRLLLLLSLNSVLFQGADNRALADNLLRQASGDINVRYSAEDQDFKLFERLKLAHQEKIFIFSTTSQISNASLDQLQAVASQISELNMFLVSPLIESDAALLELRKEYDVPNCALPKGQFLENQNLDLIRRVIRILAAVEAMLEFKQRTGINVRLWLFRQKYPDLKVRILADRGYMQVLPGPLKYANNIYRFGFEITDKDLIEPLVAAIRRLMDDTAITTHTPLDPIHLRQLTVRALRESCRFLLRTIPRPVEALQAARPQFRFVIRHPKTDAHLDALESALLATSQFIDEFDFSRRVDHAERVDAPIRSEEPPGEHRIVVRRTVNGAQHVSVGVLLVNDSRLLMIHKSAPQYAGQRSIVAGHLEDGETPFGAIKREVHEELGITLIDGQCELIRRYENIPGDICRYGAHNHEWYVFVSDQSMQALELKPTSQEIAGLEWVKFEEVGKIERITFASRRILTDLGLLR